MSIKTILASQLREINNPVLIDVRTPAEFNEVRAKNAKNFPLDSLDPKAIVKEISPSSDEPIYIICKMGGRSHRACEQFISEGIQNVVNVLGGTDSWVEIGAPVEREE